MSTIYVNAHSFAALDLASELFYGAQSPLNHKPSLLDLRSGSEPLSENLRRLLSITFVHGLAAGMVGGGWTYINESSALHFKTDTTSILDARVPLLSRQPKLKTRCRFSSSIPTARTSYMLHEFVLYIVNVCSTGLCLWDSTLSLATQVETSTSDRLRSTYVPPWCNLWNCPKCLKCNSPSTSNSNNSKYHINIIIIMLESIAARRL
ncbi:hypothetical protein Bca4012_046189 [Brassica carinata]